MNSRESHQEKVLKSAKTFFTRWIGAPAEMQELTIGHKTLRILVQHGNGPTNLVVSCIDPKRVTGPVRWSASQLEASVCMLPSTGKSGYRVVDKAAGVEVICAALEVKENVKLKER